MEKFSRIKIKPLQACGLSAVLAFGFGASSVNAQSGEEIDEIIVTATKREERLRDVPMSISVLGANTIESKGLFDMGSIASAVPGLTYAESSSNLNPTFVMRGIAVGQNLEGLQKPVAVYLDEMPMQDGKSTVNMSFGLWDVERVEVLKGPQGTLFGAGTLAGAIRIISKKPDPSGVDYKFSSDIGTTSGEMRQRYNAMYNVPLSDSMAFRMSASIADEAGWVANTGIGMDPSNNYESVALKAAIGWEVNDRLMADFTYMYQDNLSDDGGTVNPNLEGQTRSNFKAEMVEAKLNRFNLTLNYDLDFATITSSSNFSETDPWQETDLSAIFGGAFPMGIVREDKSEAFVQEVRMVSTTDSDLDWVIGAFHMDREVIENQVFHTTDAFVDSKGGSIGGMSNDYMNTNNAFIYGSPVTDNLKETAFFAEVGYQVTDSLKATVGFRTSEVEIKNMRTAGGSSNLGSFLGPVVFMGGDSFTPVPYNYGEYAPGKVKPNTMKFSLAWQASDNVNYYATASEGFRANDVNRAAFVNDGVSTVDPTDTVIPKLSKPDTLWNYEAGMKGQWDTISANVAVYKMVWEDIQLFAQRLSDPATFFTNAGEAESTGVELDIIGRPNESFEYGLSIASQDAEITSISEVESTMVGAVVGSPLSSPDLQVSGHVQNTTPLSGGNEMFWRVDLSYVDSMTNGFPFTPGQADVPSANFGYTDEVTKVDLSLGYVTDKWSAVLYAENAFDDDGYTFIMPQTFFDDRHMTLRPRTVGVRFTLSK